MPDTADYPIMLNLVGKVCVVVGGGQIATRKITSLLAHGAQIVVVSPNLTPTLQRLVAEKIIEWRPQVYATGILNKYKPTLVFAATDRPAVNRIVAEDTQSIGAWVNVVDGETDSDFSNMISLSRPPLKIGISTGGASPALAKHLRHKLNELIGDEYHILAQWLGDLRDALQDSTTTQAERAAIYDQILESKIPELLQAGQTEDAYVQFQALSTTQPEVQA